MNDLENAANDDEILKIVAGDIDYFAQDLADFHAYCRKFEKEMERHKLIILH